MLKLCSSSLSSAVKHKSNIDLVFLIMMHGLSVEGGFNLHRALCCGRGLRGYFEGWSGVAPSISREKEAVVDDVVVDDDEGYDELPLENYPAR